MKGPLAWGHKNHDVRGFRRFGTQTKAPDCFPLPVWTWGKCNLPCLCVMCVFGGWSDDVWWFILPPSTEQLSSLSSAGSQAEPRGSAEGNRQGGSSPVLPSGLSTVVGALREREGGILVQCIFLTLNVPWRWKWTERLFFSRARAFGSSAPDSPLKTRSCLEYERFFFVHLFYCFQLCNGISQSAPSIKQLICNY